jgi:hypothetical protein
MADGCCFKLARLGRPNLDGHVVAQSPLVVLVEGKVSLG